ncbi:MAG TPA: 30S ribosomal protein S20 [Verrucomicrobiales bacterium]|jgi:small subunit ribosomal protein S20|nr:30S ribosomal protein S20 [Verrucomicrobiales bacterium]
MANIKSAEKRVRQTATRTLRNKSTKTRVKNARKLAVEAVTSGDKSAAAKVSALASAADKAANRGVIHKNKASRIKARIARDAKKQK